LIEALLEGEAEKLSRKAVELAMEGDSTAMRLCMERLMPPMKGRPVVFPLPKIEKVEDLPAAMTAVTEAMANGIVTPEEAAVVASVIETQRRTMELTSIEQRLK
jgi:hypothetical protein